MILSCFCILWSIDAGFWPCNTAQLLSFVSLIGVIIGAFVFVNAVIWSRLFTVREWLMLPFGKKILRINKQIKK